MAVNKNALIRYKTIDKCLQNRYRQWTLEDLIDACSDALYEYEGVDKGVSKRTVQADIQIMRSEKLGYFAPIVVIDKKYYTYEDKDYSITNTPLSSQDLQKLTEVVDFMKQFQGFSHFRELDSMVQKMEDHIYVQRTHESPIIDFEKNEDLKGLEFLDALYNAIKNKVCICITYQSFKARKPDSFDFHPYLLKEFRNRWFVIGQKSAADAIFNLALDRILDINKSNAPFQHNFEFNPKTYFNDVIGVTVSRNLQPMTVELLVDTKHAPYIRTKPLHHSQIEVSSNDTGVIFTIHVQHNMELEKEILSFGDQMHVLKPEKLRNAIKRRIQNSTSLYEVN
ncbi:MAG: WYL domain-containing protein [Flavobacteriales bacterium]|nr:WYL domain-containing protein [Flavobacteriales bacterium]